MQLNGAIMNPKECRVHGHTVGFKNFLTWSSDRENLVCASCGKIMAGKYDNIWAFIVTAIFSLPIGMVADMLAPVVSAGVVANMVV